MLITAGLNMRGTSSNPYVDTLIKCHSVVFDTTWKLTLKVPHKKTICSLDATVDSPAKRMALTTSATPTKKICWQDLEVVSPDEE
jgi:hypothetical protein